MLGGKRAWISWFQETFQNKHNVCCQALGESGMGKGCWQEQPSAMCRRQACDQPIPYTVYGVVSSANSEMRPLIQLSLTTV